MLECAIKTGKWLPGSVLGELSRNGRLPPPPHTDIILEPIRQFAMSSLGRGACIVNRIEHFLPLASLEVSI